ncbi:MAG: DUF433 domain-containing protein [Nitrosomonas sp.]|nr:DUF433 domain-containing protein [Nitrosomonas sp.]
MTEIIESYPRITQEDIWAALAFAVNVMQIKPFITVY